MAAPVVQSNATKAWTFNSDSFTVTKPAGLSEGDMLFCVVFANKDATGTGLNAPTMSGFTEDASQTYGTSNARVHFFSKEADASDVAASNFTVTTNRSGTASAHAAVLMRITGGVAGNPVVASDGDIDDDGGAGVSASISLETTYDDALIFFALTGNGTTSNTVSGYSVSGTNPSWTEVFDNTDNSTRDHVCALAYATISSARELTTASATLSTGSANCAVLLGALPEPQAVTATPDSISLNGVVPTQSPKAKVTASPAAVTIVSGQSAPTTEARTKVWTTIVKT